MSEQKNLEIANQFLTMLGAAAPPEEIAGLFNVTAPAFKARQGLKDTLKG